MIENEMVGWNHWLNGLVSEQTPEIVKDREDCPGKTGVLQAMGSQRVGHDLATEQEEYSASGKSFKAASPLGACEI